MLTKPSAVFSLIPAPLRLLGAALVLMIAAAACSSTVVATDTPATTEAAAATTVPTTPTPTTVAPTTVAPTTVAPTTVPQTTPPTTVPAAASAGEGSVATLLDAGAEPRQELRFDYVDGDTFAFDVETTQSLSQVIDGIEGPPAAPVITRLGQSGTVSLVDGAYVLESTTDSAEGLVEGDEATTAQVQLALDDLVGLVERRTVDATGVVLDFILENAEGVDPSVLGPAEGAGENGVALAFPVEPVGLGGSWETVAILEINGLTVEQVSTYVVLGIDGTIVDLSVTTSQFVAPGSAMDIPGAEATVNAWSAEGRGTITVDLTKVPATSSIGVDVFQTLAIKADGQEVELVQQVSNQTVSTPR